MINRNPEVSDLVLVRHPFPADERTVDQRIQAIHRKQGELGINNLLIIDSDSKLAEMRDSLEPLIGQNTQVEVLGGDGTASMVFSALSKIDKAVRFNTPGGGGACDIAHQSHPNFINRKSTSMSVFSPSIAHRPLLIEASHPDIEDDAFNKSLLAVSYFSLGFTALMSEIYNSEEFRSKMKNRHPKIRLANQALEIGKNIGQDTSFIADDGEGASQLSELVITNGNRMGGGSVHFYGNQLLGEGYGILDVDRTITWPVLAQTVGKAALGLYKKAGPDSVRNFTVSSLNGSDIVAQYDGETVYYPSGTLLSISTPKSKIEIVTSDIRYQTEHPLAA